MKKRYLSNYSIENIAQSIVQDNETGKRYTLADKKRLYREGIRLAEGVAGLHDLLSLDQIRSFDMPWSKRLARLAVLPPQLVVVDERIQDMCYLPFWTYYGSGEGSFRRCAGVGAFSCCPPFNPGAEKVRALLDRADIFFVLQSSPMKMFSSGDPGGQFRVLNRLAGEVEDLLGRGSVVQKFGGGPCFACYPEYCEGGGKCRTPRLKVPSLEGMGICVDQLCKDLSLLTGDEGWKITWIKGFGTPEQRPKKMKGTMGLAIRFPD